MRLSTLLFLLVLILWGISLFMGQECCMVLQDYPEQVAMHHLCSRRTIGGYFPGGRRIITGVCGGWRGGGGGPASCHR